MSLPLKITQMIGGGNVRQIKDSKEWNILAVRLSKKAK